MPFLNTNSNKAALIIGINYIGMKGELKGCINDTKNIKQFLKEKCGFSDLSIFLLTEETSLKPTKENILKAITNFVIFIKNNNVKEAWFSYSGHGHYLESREERDGKDECLVPLDYDISGGVTDNDIYDNLIKNIPYDCSLFSLIDACHSGTALDLPFLYRFDKGIVQQKKPENLANIIKISGCRDYQTSMDSYLKGQFQGALTACFLKSVKDLEYKFTVLQLIKQIKNYIYGGNYKQIPTLSFSNEELLHNVVMGSLNKLFNNCNVEICLVGDDWCDQETEWNIYNLEKNEKLFKNDLKFYKRNEKVKLQLNLDNGRHIIVMKDNYGDGGVESGYIKYIKNQKIIKNFKFNDGLNKSIDFTVNKIDSNKIDETEYLVKINVIGDKYSAYETTWNILHLDGKEVFNSDKHFRNTSSYTIELKLKRGEYKFKCMDSWGDGGMSGVVTHNYNELLNFNFRKNKLNFYNFFLPSM